MSNRAEERRKQRSQAEGRSETKPFHWVLGGVGVLAVLLIGWNLVSSSIDNTVREPVEIVFETPAELVAMAQGIRVGPADAPISIVEFADYACPSCQVFAANVKPLLDLTYADDDRVQYIFFDYPMLQNAYVAARAARCAGDQDAYWNYHDVLFQNQMSWSRMADPVGAFEDYAGEIGIDRGDFRSCLRSDRHAEVVSANAMLGQRLGVGGTPWVIVNTGEGGAQQVNEWANPESIRAIVNAGLERLGGAAAADSADASAESGAAPGGTP